MESFNAHTKIEETAQIREAEESLIEKMIDMYSLGSMAISKEKEKTIKNSFAGRKVTNARQTTAPRVGPLFFSSLNSNC